MTPRDLEVAWEGVQDIYSTYANIYAYRYGLKTFCSFGEKTYVIINDRKKIAGYYRVSEMNQAAKAGLKDFIKKEWRLSFQERAHAALRRARGFVERTHLVCNDLPKEKLFSCIKEGTDILNEVFTVFTASQPQYTMLVEDYVKGQLSPTISDEEENVIFATLTHSDKKTPLVEEEIAWNLLLGSGVSEKALDEHARRFGLLNAADGQGPYTRDSLKKRAENGPIVVNWESQQAQIHKEKLQIITKYKISNEVVDFCQDIAELGHIRLCLRLAGWMPLAYILNSELFSQLPRFVPYSHSQLLCCLPEELLKIFDGDYHLSPEKLDERSEYTVYGLLEGEEFLWQGEQGRAKARELIPEVDLHVGELSGQTGWKGKVKGRCYVLRWDARDLTKEIVDMPEGAVLIAGQTRPQLMPAIKKASAIVTDEGGLLSHAAIISRELRKPSVIGTKSATKVFKTGDLVEVDAEKGIVKKL